MGNQSVECGKWEILTFPQNLPRRGSARNPRPDCIPRKGQSVVTCMSKQSWKWAQVITVPSQDTYGHPVIPVPSERTSISRCMDKQSEVMLPSQDTYGQTVTASARESSVPAAPAVRRTELVARGPVAVFVAAHFATDTGVVNHPVAVDIAMQHVRREQHLTQRSAAENMQNFDTFLLENHQRVFLLVTPFLF